MERVELKEGVSLSRLVYGMWRIGDDADTSAAHVAKKINACLDQGITTIDQADIYGGYTAEAILGAALKADKTLRGRIEIVTKCGIVAPAGRHGSARLKHYDTSRAHIESSVAHSLKDMGTDYIDLLLIHRPDPLMDHQETGAVLDDLVKSGKVRTVGVSNFRPWDFDLLQSAMRETLVTNQIEISLSEIAPFTNGDIAFHQKNGQPLMAWSPLGGGSLIGNSGALGVAMDALASVHGVDRATIATAFLLHHPARIMPVLGTNNLARIAAIGKAMDVHLDRQEWFALYEAALGKEVP